METVYLDHNATTPLRPEVRGALLETLDLVTGNPSSVHAAGRAARALVDEARERVAGALRIAEDEVVFTSGGTESDQLAILGALEGAPARRSGFVTTVVEHSAVLGAAEVLERRGSAVRRLPVDAEGLPDPAGVARAAREVHAGLVSVMAVNNELGSYADLPAIRAALEAAWSATPGPAGDPAGGSADGPATPRSPARPLFHSDAVQALGKVAIDFAEWGVDLASFSLHKVGGPLGVGVLVVRRGARLGAPAGEAQELGLRAGTENVPGIVAGALALELAVTEQAEFASRALRLGKELWDAVRSSFPGARLLGPPLESARRATNTLNISLPGVDGRVLVTRLDLAGLQVSAGSACASGSLAPSHVLLALGLDDERARSGLRVSFGRTSTREDVHTAVDILRRTLSSSR